jgi:hypothetical protein
MHLHLVHIVQTHFGSRNFNFWVWVTFLQESPSSEIFRHFQCLLFYGMAIRFVRIIHVPLHTEVCLVRQQMACTVRRSYLSNGKPTDNGRDDPNHFHKESLDPNHTRDLHTIQVTFHLWNSTSCSNWLKQDTIINEDSVLLGCDAASVCNPIPTFSKQVL